MAYSPRGFKAFETRQVRLAVQLAELESAGTVMSDECIERHQRQGIAVGARARAAGGDARASGLYPVDRKEGGAVAEGGAPGGGEQRLQTVCLLLLTAFAVAAALYWLSSVLIPFILALLVTIAVRPVVSLLTRRARIPRSLAVGVVFLLGLLVFSVAGGLVSSSVRQLAANAEVYQQTITGLAESALTLVPIERFGKDAAARNKFGL